MNWKKLIYAVIAAVVVFAVFAGFGALVSPYVVYALLGLAAGAAVYFLVAVWEIQKLAENVGVKLP